VPDIPTYVTKKIIDFGLEILDIFIFTLFWLAVSKIVIVSPISS